LDNQDFIQIEKDGYIYFLNSENDTYSEIVFDITKHYCFISPDLIREICDFFTIDKTVSKDNIGIWVENTLGVDISEINPNILMKKYPFKFSD
jgi:hypothetical protein